MPLSEYNRALGNIVFDAVDGRPTFRRHHDHTRDTLVDMARFENSPSPGHDTFATLGVSYAPMMDGGSDSGLRVELIGTCRDTWPEFAEMMADVAFGVIAGEEFVYPGRVMPGLVERYYPDLPTRHVLLQPPFLWESLGRVEVLDRTVLWLTPVPISESELDYMRQYGEERLVELLIDEDADFTDLAREAAV